jgi:hypothetical protein
MSVIKQRQRAPTGISRRSIVITGSDCALLQAASLSLIIAAALINAENAFMCALKFHAVVLDQTQALAYCYIRGLQQRYCRPKA